MNSEQLLQQTHAVDAISRELGVDPATARTTSPTADKPKDHGA